MNEAGKVPTDRELNTLVSQLELKASIPLLTAEIAKILVSTQNIESTATALAYMVLDIANKPHKPHDLSDKLRREIADVLTQMLKK